MTTVPGKLLSKLVTAMREAIGEDRFASPLALHEVVQDLVDEAPACVLVTDSFGQLVAASKRALAVLDHTHASLRALNVTDLAANEERGSVEPLWESFLRERRQSGRFTLRARNGGSITTRYAAQANVVAGLSVAVHVVEKESQ
jgi:PAS domain-containing protein